MMIATGTMIGVTEIDNTETVKDVIGVGTEIEIVMVNRKDVK
jgi:hypothetical protein